MFCRLRDEGQFAVVVPLIPASELAPEASPLEKAFAGVPLSPEEELPP
jgi:hypothetical protein